MELACRRPANIKSARQFLTWNIYEGHKVRCLLLYFVCNVHYSQGVPKGPPDDQNKLFKSLITWVFMDKK